MVKYGQYKAIDQQVREWLDRNTGRETVSTKKRVSSVITISREWGSRGSEVAYLLQKKLGDPWRVWDKQIIEEISKRADVRDEVVKAIEDKGASQFESFFRGLLTGENFSQHEYRRHVTSIILALGHQGHAIILGRGGNFILPRSFRVRIVASRKFRIHTLTTENKVNEEEASILMRQSDHERAEFVKQIFNEEINSPWNYDLCLKTNYIKPKTVVDIIFQGARDKLRI